MVIHHKIVPGLQFTLIWFTSEVAKVTFPCPSLLIMYYGGYFNACIYVVLVPLKDIPDDRHVFMVLVVGGEGGLLLHPCLADVRDVKGVQV